MIVKHFQDVKGEEVGTGVLMRWVISKGDGAENFYMRVIEAGPGTQGPPKHHHDYEHEIFILEGEGVLVGEQGERPFKAGDVVFIPPNENHQLKHPKGVKFI